MQVFELLACLGLISGNPARLGEIVNLLSACFIRSTVSARLRYRFRVVLWKKRYLVDWGVELLVLRPSPVGCIVAEVAEVAVCWVVAGILG